jgi:DNA-directed RNA polymerase specialized sigma24 family protein
MSGTETKRAQWQLTAPALAKLLASLTPDPEQAGARYEAVRLALVKFFDWQGAALAEDLADETLNRVARKLDEGETLRDVPTFCHGVARLVLLEYRRTSVQRQVDIEEITPVAAPTEIDEPDERRACLDGCLSELPVESRQLILRYYRDDRQQKIDARAALAAQLGLPLNALRSRAQRIRDRLEQCVKRCVVRKNLRGR